jgi:uncharacterized protein
LQNESGIRPHDRNGTSAPRVAPPRIANSADTTFAKLDCAFPAGATLTVPELLRADEEALIADLGEFVRSTSGKDPAAAEVFSWRSSIPRLRRLLDDPRLRGLTVLLEVATPLSSGRMDCVLLGSAAELSDSIVILELKAWSDARRSPHPSEMLIPILSRGEDMGPKIHPSRQASQYRSRLQDLLVACHDQARVSVFAAAWLHSVGTCARPPFNDAEFGDALRSAPAFGDSQTEELREHLSAIAPFPPHSGFLSRLERSDVAPSPSLIERYANRVGDSQIFCRADEEIDTLDRIAKRAITAYQSGEGTAIIVPLRPRAGASTLALRLLRELHRNGVPALYAGKSGRLIHSYKKAFPDSQNLFANFGHLGNGQAKALVVDQAHRLHGPAGARECASYARLTTFLIDENETIVPEEIEKVRFIAESARSNKLRPSERRRTEVLTLPDEQRCGSEVYARWIDHVLHLPRARRPRMSSSYDFAIVDSPEELESKLRASGGTWRIVAGICWKRSAPTASGELINDIVIADFKHSWSPRPDALEEGSSRHEAAICWATEPDAQLHVGNVYTAASFGFDYVGVIFGNDLIARNDRWDFQRREHPQQADGPLYKGPVANRRMPECARKAYRILLTRGLRGCYVFFQDLETRRYVERVMAESEPGL